MNSKMHRFHSTLIQDGQPYWTANSGFLTWTLRLMGVFLVAKKIMNSETLAVAPASSCSKDPDRSSTWKWLTPELFKIDLREFWLERLFLRTDGETNLHSCTPELAAEAVAELNQRQEERVSHGDGRTGQSRDLSVAQMKKVFENFRGIVTLMWKTIRLTSMLWLMIFFKDLLFKGLLDTLVIHIPWCCCDMSRL